MDSWSGLWTDPELHNNYSHFESVIFARAVVLLLFDSVNIDKKEMYYLTDNRLAIEDSPFLPRHEL